MRGPIGVTGAGRVHTDGPVYVVWLDELLLELVEAPEVGLYGALGAGARVPSSLIAYRPEGSLIVTGLLPA